MYKIISRLPNTHWECVRIPERLHTLLQTRLYTSPVVLCAEQEPADTQTVFVCRRGVLIPISKDAELIFAANSHSVEQYTKQQLLPNVQKTQTRDHQMSLLNDDVISSQVYKLSMAEPVGKKNLLHFSSQVAEDESSSQLNSDSIVRSTNQNKDAAEEERKRRNLPTNEQLNLMKENLLEQFPQFFRRSHKFNLYAPDIMFENNYWGQNKVCRGINSYAWELMKLRWKANLAYCSIDLYIINITTHPEDGSIRVRWTMKGIPQLQGFMFWRFNLFNLKGKGGVKDSMRNTMTTFDGFNIFWLNKDGAIARHRLDKVMPDEERKVSIPVEKISKILNVKKALDGTSNASSTTKYTQNTAKLIT